ncbi:hypothetical protein [Fodinibius sediminis]|uniref:Uncharacterized protein n=1 Tax=Fodinibius sediminis TaxID=1214077 RepID=A0A521DCZ8_9BACT|nr:hypothetical protein [Fodinibius sediminis]SMO69021.1 hypothetical protein SAMN06265218_109136 [Fodinibius sediminis]
MPIPKKGIALSLKKATPTQLDVESLKKQLHHVGLTCKHTSTENLKEYKEEVISQFPPGEVNTFGILKYKENPNGSPHFNDELGPLEADYNGLESSSKGNWEPSDTGLGYSSELEYIQFPTHFDYLMKHRPSFTGVTEEPPVYRGNYNTVEAIKNLFTNVGTTASSTLVKGLDKSSIESVLSNAIAPLNDKNAKDYDETDSRVIFLVDNYNDKTEEADAIGVLTINWHLKIKDYKEKKESLKHKTCLKIRARTVLYDDIKVLHADKKFVESHFKSKAYCLSIPPKHHGLKIFDRRPPATENTFNRGLPVISKEKYVEVIILHSANLEEVGCLDNTNSDVSSKYSKSTTSGFTFSMSQTLSAELSFEADVEFVKAGIKIGFSLTFTETWNKSQTETIDYSVPAGKKAFVYQGYLHSSILRYNPESDTYKYVDNGRFLTNIFKTSEEPILDN